jgi:hypothetical protein
MVHLLRPGKIPCTVQEVVPPALQKVILDGSRNDLDRNAGVLLLDLAMKDLSLLLVVFEG